jgi:hypothetical protein
MPWPLVPPCETSADPRFQPGPQGWLLRSIALSNSLLVQQCLSGRRLCWACSTWQVQLTCGLRLCLRELRELLLLLLLLLEGLLLLLLLRR